jgi:hypothetical protein
MNKLFLFLILCLSSVASAKPNLAVKQKVVEELELLTQDLQVADSLVRELQQDNLKVQQSLKDVESWGVAQQEEKEKYYEEALSFENRLAESRRQIDLEKLKQKELTDKYRQVKQTFGYICGGLFAFLYLTVLAPGIKNFLTVFGAWSPVISILSPLIAFGAGYFLIYFIF